MDFYTYQQIGTSVYTLIQFKQDIEDLAKEINLDKDELSSMFKTLEYIFDKID